MLAACDVYRPAAADQLATLGGEIGVRELSAEQYVDILVSGGRPLINVDTLPAPAQELSGSECKILPLN